MVRREVLDALAPGLSWTRLQRAVVLAILGAALAPLLWFKYLPSTDLPNHVAIASVIWRLLFEAGTATGAHYALNVQPVPYYLAYGLLAPLTGIFGPFVGAKLTLAIIAVATFAGAWLLFRALRGPWWSPVAGVFLFYGSSFFWGFVPTLIGIPAILFGAWALAMLLRTGHTRFVAIAAIAGVLATLSHVVLVVPWAAFVAAYLLAPLSLRRSSEPASAHLERQRKARRWRSRRSRRALACAAVIMAAASLPLVPALVSLAMHATTTTAGISEPPAGPPIEPATFAAFRDRLRMQFAIFDRGVGRTAHLVFFVGAIALAIAALRRRRRANESASASAGDGDGSAAASRFARWAALLQVVAYCATPLALSFGGSYAWGVNFRYFPFVEAAIVGAVAVSDGVAEGRRRWIGALGAALAAAYVVALIAFFARFDGTALQFDRVLASVRPEGATLAVVSRPERFSQAWAPVLQHTHGYWVASGGAYDPMIFAEKQTPIRPVRRVSGSIDPARPVVGEFDYLLVQEIATPATIPAPEDGSLVVEAGPWRLYRRSP